MAPPCWQGGNQKKTVPFRSCLSCLSEACQPGGHQKAGWWSENVCSMSPTILFWLATPKSPIVIRSFSITIRKGGNQRPNNREAARGSSVEGGCFVQLKQYRPSYKWYITFTYIYPQLRLLTSVSDLVTVTKGHVHLNPIPA